MVEHIEPCPYCGSIHIDILYAGMDESDAAWLSCADCGAESKVCGSGAEAIAAHNKVSRNNAAAEDLRAALKLIMADYARVARWGFSGNSLDACLAAIAKGESHV